MLILFRGIFSPLFRKVVRGEYKCFLDCEEKGSEYRDKRFRERRENWHFYPGIGGTFTLEWVALLKWNHWHF